MSTSHEQHMMVMHSFTCMHQGTACPSAHARIRLRKHGPWASRGAGKHSPLVHRPPQEGCWARRAGASAQAAPRLLPLKCQQPAEQRCQCTQASDADASSTDASLLSSSGWMSLLASIVPWQTRRCGMRHGVLHASSMEEQAGACVPNLVLRPTP